MWDQRYSTPEYVYGTEPNAFVAAQAWRVPPGPVVCVGAGEGRNAVFLAQQGHEVEAVDASTVGLSKAQQLAAERGVVIRTVVADLADYDLGEGRWAGVVQVFCHLQRPLRQRVHEAIVAALRPGGVLLMVAYTPRQLGRQTGGPQAADLLYEPDELRQEFAGLQLLHAEEQLCTVNEGRFHTGEAAVVQIIGVKPCNGP